MPGSGDGIKPHTNSHYSRHLLGVWGLVSLRSGQEYSARSASLGFSPQPGVRQWAFFAPQGNGLVARVAARRAGSREGTAGRAAGGGGAGDGGECVGEALRIEMLSGELSVRSLSVYGVDLLAGRGALVLRAPAAAELCFPPATPTTARASPRAAA